MMCLSVEKITPKLKSPIKELIVDIALVKK